MINPNFKRPCRAIYQDKEKKFHCKLPEELARRLIRLAKEKKLEPQFLLFEILEKHLK